MQLPTFRTMKKYASKFANLRNTQVGSSELPETLGFFRYSLAKLYHSPTIPGANQNISKYRYNLFESPMRK